MVNFGATFDQAFFEQGLPTVRPLLDAPAPYIMTASPARVTAQQVQPRLHRSKSFA